MCALCVLRIQYRAYLAAAGAAAGVDEAARGGQVERRPQQQRQQNRARQGRRLDSRGVFGVPSAARGSEAGRSTGPGGDGGRRRHRAAARNRPMAAPPAAKGLLRLFPSRLHADTLDPHEITTPHSTHPSESSLAEPLNYSPAPRSSSSLPTSTTTFDFTSFTTASQQSTWLPSPAPQASRPLQQLPSDFAPAQTDFVLFDQPAQQPQRAPSAPQPGLTFNPVHQFYANSAPSSTTGFQQPQLQHLAKHRPPVPLFNNSNSNTSQPVTNMADLNSNNSFDSNLGAGLGPAFASDMSFDYSGAAFTSINDPSNGSTRTVSPKDIFADPLGSAPPSTAFTNLTSPDIGESPFLTDSYDTSPMFQPDAVMHQDTWFSLFPEDAEKPSPPAALVAPGLERTISSNSMARSSSSSTNSPLILDNAHRRKSSVTGSPATNASVTKPRRRKGPLPPIAVDPSDKVALKRARNTLAARDSRQRKFDHVATLERRNAELEAELEKWKNIALAQGYTE